MVEVSNTKHENPAYIMKADPKTKAPFDQEQTARCKTFIWLPFAGGLSAFAVVLPQPFPW
jgi:hypothetical protein